MSEPENLTEFTDSTEFTDEFTDHTEDEDLLRGGPPGLEPGETVAPSYEIIEHLHRSNRFDVYDAWSEERASRCIAKTPIPDRLERDVIQSLFREGRLLRWLTHPHIVRAYEVLREPRPVVIFETLTGETLSHLIDARERRLPLAEVAHLGLHLCSALHYLHRHEILHLDLKPSNIVSERGVAKILDLSIARKPAKKSKPGEGTVHYLAPEQATGDPISFATDVWGMGSVLFETATGELPFNAEAPDTSDDAEEKYEQLERAIEPVNSHRRVPKALAGIIESCLEPDPEDRPTVAEVSRRLGEFLERAPRN